MPVAEISNLYKSYGDKTAVKNLTFSIHEGESLGLIGPNGAGKSSTIRTMLDFMKPDSGEVKIFGHRINETSKNKIGYLPEERGLYKRLSVFEHIIYFATLKGMNKAEAEKKAEELLKRTGMIESKKTKIKELSKGMAQMIQFIITIIHDPMLIILDEPFSGLDPVNTELLKRLISELRNKGKAVIFSTHQMNQVEELCDRVLMINQGSEVLYGDLRDIKVRFRKHSVIVNVEGEIDDLEGVIKKKIIKDSIELILASDATPQFILDQLRNRGTILNRFEVQTPSLNEIFLTIAGGIDE